MNRAYSNLLERLGSPFLGVLLFVIVALSGIVAGFLMMLGCVVNLAHERTGYRIFVLGQDFLRACS